MIGMEREEAQKMTVSVGNRAHSLSDTETVNPLVALEHRIIEVQEDSSHESSSLSAVVSACVP